MARTSRDETAGPIITVNSNSLRQALLLCVAICGCSAAHASEGEITSSAIHSGPEFSVIGFADVNYISADGNEPDGFALGQAVAHLVASLDESLTAFGEFSATAKDSEYSFEVERLIIKYDFSDLFKLSAGRYHTPIGYWNSAFHHGAWLQTTTSRPEMAKFGSKILPIHFVGVLLEGNLPSGDLGLEYKAGLGNGRHANISRGGDAGDINGDKAWTVQVLAKPRNAKGLNAGVGFYSDEVTLPDSPNVRESTLSAYAVWGYESPEIIFEYIHSMHELVTDSSIDGDVDAWYAQFAYRLKGTQRAWKPYLRLERTRVDDSDPLLGSESLDYDGGILGVRWDFNPYAALKAEYRNEEFDNGGRENNFRVQLAIVLTSL
jgi:hypothetical protein